MRDDLQVESSGWLFQGVRHVVAATLQATQLVISIIIISSSSSSSSSSTSSSNNNNNIKFRF